LRANINKSSGTESEKRWAQAALNTTTVRHLRASPSRVVDAPRAEINVLLCAQRRRELKLPLNPAAQPRSLRSRDRRTPCAAPPVPILPAVGCLLQWCHCPGYGRLAAAGQPPASGQAGAHWAATRLVLPTVTPAGGLRRGVVGVAMGSPAGARCCGSSCGSSCPGDHAAAAAAAAAAVTADSAPRVVRREAQCLLVNARNNTRLASSST
jgi:hypothetical protein